MALEYDSAAGERPLEMGGEVEEGTGRGLEGDVVWRWSDMMNGWASLKRQPLSSASPHSPPYSLSLL